MCPARLPLSPWSGPCPSASYFFAEGAVLWLGNSRGQTWLSPLREELEVAGRLWAPTVTTQPVPRPGSGSNPWAFRPDDYAPLRWGVPDEDTRDVAELPGRPRALSGLVVDGLLGGLGSQPARTLLGQVAGLLASDAPWLLFDRNGGSATEIVRNFRRSEDERGEGRSTARNAQELRRLLEVAGLGVTAAWGVAPRPGRRLRGLVPAGAAWPFLFIEGRGVRAPGE
jgi:hypothetical protein